MPARSGSAVPFDTGLAAATRWATVPADGTPWQFTAPSAGVVAVGDVQGDLTGLDAILQATELVDAGGDWVGGRRQLVLVGDLIGGHADSRLCAAWVMRLEQQARRAGGAVHALLGNHDVLPARGEIDKWTADEKELYRRHPSPGAPSGRARDAWRGDGVLARWLRGRNAIVRIGDTLFVHAGLDEWFAETDPAAVNASVRAWVAHWQGVADEPPQATCWTVGTAGMARDSELARGPLWLRCYKPDGDRRPDGGPTRRQLHGWLDDRGLRRLVVGHAPVDGDDVLLRHPYYGDRVVLLDTRIADRRGGSLTALRLNGGTAEGLWVPPGARDPSVRQRERDALLREGAPRWRRFLGWVRRPFS